MEVRVIGIDLGTTIFHLIGMDEHGGAQSVCLHVHREEHACGNWITSLRDRKPSNVATVALANKLARVA